MLNEKTYVLDVLSLSSDPISRLSGVNELCANDNWILERNQPDDVDDPLLREQHDSKISAILGENYESKPESCICSESYIYKETLKRIDDQYHYSWKIPYDHLSNKIMYDISCRYGFNTMAYHEKWQYSRANHSHDYNIVACTPHVTYNDVVNAYSPNVQIMSYNTSRAGYGKNDNASFDILKTISTIKRKQATIICLQEVEHNNPNTGNMHFVDTIKLYLGQNWHGYYSGVAWFDSHDNLVVVDDNDKVVVDADGKVVLDADKREALAADGKQNGSSGLGILCKGQTPKLDQEGNIPFVVVKTTKMLIAEFEDFVVANLHLPAYADETWLTSIKRHFDENAYDGKAIFIAGSWNKTPEQVLGTLSNFTIITKQEPTNIVNEVHDFILIDKQHYDALHNMSNSIVDDLVASDHKPTCASFFYNDDYTKLDEWLGSMKIWKLSSWETTESNGKWDYKVLHKEYIPTQFDIYYPHIEFPKYQIPEVGEMQFLARCNLPTTESTTNPRVDETGLLYDEEIDAYWAYPNGQVITCNSFDFVDACKLYGNQNKDGTDTSFTIPLLSDFFRPCYPGMKHKLHSYVYNANSVSPIVNELDVVPLQHLDSQVGVPNHTHTIADSGSNEITIKDNVVIPSSTAPANGSNSTNLTHSGGARKPTEQNCFLTRVEIDIKNWTTHSNSTFTDFSQTSLADIDTYPTHQHMPAIVYIGRR